MFLDAPNPTQVQFTPASKRSNPPPPLILIHDGGGTTFSYFIIGHLGREVWAIHNPRHWDGSHWEGGIDEMARHYIHLIQAAGISGTVLLGGWSFGGVLSIAMARMLADDVSCNITVAGLLLIDCSYHTREPIMTTATSNDVPGSASETFLKDWPELVQKSFEDCCLMLEMWDLPKWDGPTNGGKSNQVKILGKNMVLEHGHVLHKAVGDSWKITKTKTYQEVEPAEQPSCPPPALMIRCTKPGSLPAADIYRREVLLGWEGNYPEFVKVVIDVEAEHFTIFDKSDHIKMRDLTAQLVEGLDVLDSLHAHH